MQREIKFRVWNPEWGMLIQPEDIISFHLDFDTSTIADVKFCIRTTDGGLHEQLWEDDPALVFLQFTGLFDIDGREIFEGDILESNVMLSGSKTMSVVKWNEAGFIGNGSLSNNPVYMQNHQLKVMGNIYENPELLECQIERTTT